MMKKNKILVDNIILNNEDLTLENKTITKIDVKGNCKLNLYMCNIINLEINILDGSSLILNYYNEIDNLDTNIDIKTHNSSGVIFNHSFINKDK